MLGGSLLNWRTEQDHNVTSPGVQLKRQCVPGGLCGQTVRRVNTACRRAGRVPPATTSVTTAESQVITRT
jgi:hypothetical protein